MYMEAFLKLLKVRLDDLFDEDNLGSGSCNNVVGCGSTGKIAYGTAGFRGKAETIEHLFFNVGVIAALRCLKLKSHIGLMITASHNPVQDNGVKLIDSGGGMLDPSWEPIVEDFCNFQDRSKIFDKIKTLISDHDIFPSPREGAEYAVILGKDNRPSSDRLAFLAKRGVELFDQLVSFVDYGLITTPALHYIVGESNKTGELKNPSHYYGQLATSLVRLFNNIRTENKAYDPKQLIIDCANGVGRETLLQLQEDEGFRKRLPFRLINVGEGTLNEKCGADYVKTTGMHPAMAEDTSARYASIDGDADRVVYFWFHREEGDDPYKLILLDGDRIMALFALYLKTVLSESKLSHELTVGVIQTAYANGASTEFLEQTLGYNVDCVDTGVKNLHKKALDYDFGIYFEANGHGSIHVSERSKRMVKESGHPHLIDIIELINEYTGDAVSDILVVEAILKQLDKTVSSWFGLYQELPNVLIKVSIKDKSLVKTTNAGRTCVEPVGLQAEIDNLVSESKWRARCFVRASGTENVVRIYAESRDEEEAKMLAEKVAEKLRGMC